jgi:hypothetical protein
MDWFVGLRQRRLNGNKVVAMVIDVGKLIQKHEAIAIPILMALTAVSVVGCAGSSGISEISDNTYISSKKSGVDRLTTSGSELKAELFKEANEFCSAKRKKMESLAATHFNGAQGSVPTAELQFKCVTPSRFASPPRK